MFSNLWKDYSDKRFRRTTEGLTVDPQPLPESVITVKHSNLKHMFNRSYIEAATIGAGSIAVLAMIVKYTRK